MPASGRYYYRIPAPLAYTNVVAVKKLVAGPSVWSCSWAWPHRGIAVLKLCFYASFGSHDSDFWADPRYGSGFNPLHSTPALHTRDRFFLPKRPSLGCGGNTYASTTCDKGSARGCYCEQISVSQAGGQFCLNDRAWNNKGATRRFGCPCDDHMAA